MLLSTFVKELSDILNIAGYVSADVSLNGLQVSRTKSEIHKVAFAVDASLASIEAASRQGADLLFVHHGLFWGRPVAVTGTHYRRIKALMDSDMALFACHLPLDAHLEYGHNAQMAKALGLEDIRPFAMYHGVSVGVSGHASSPMTAEQIVSRLGVRTNPTNFSVNAGSQALFQDIAIVSGSGASDVYKAIDCSMDLLITGESSYSTVNDCLEAGTGMLCLGHYETETFGLRAVMDLVRREYGLDVCFVDIPLGL